MGKLLEEMKDNLLLDIYLAPHINTLFSMIRNRGLVQYFSPYSSADLSKMANSFNTSVSSLENELMKLILDGSIQARIDSHNKVLRSAILKANISVKCTATARDQQDHNNY